jgi:hypothetical protein
MDTFISKSGSRSKGDPKAIVDIAVENETFKRIRRWGSNNKGKKYIAVIFEIEGEDYGTKIDT